MNGALERIAKLIADEFGVDPATITEATELDAMGLDSLDRVELAMLVEDEFAFEPPRHVEGDRTTVGNIVAAIAGLPS
ncbi:MAG: acyl carrier protein [Sphingomonadales bacterium]|nr:acyl carrier protein [Sphingomonadales bacterium]